MNRTVKLKEIDSDIYPLNRNGLNAFKSKHLMCFRLKLFKEVKCRNSFEFHFIDIAFMIRNGLIVYNSEIGFL